MICEAWLGVMFFKGKSYDKMCTVTANMNCMHNTVKEKDFLVRICS